MTCWPRALPERRKEGALSVFTEPTAAKCRILLNSSTWRVGWVKNWLTEGRKTLEFFFSQTKGVGQIENTWVIKYILVLLVNPEQKLCAGSSIYELDTLWWNLTSKGRRYHMETSMSHPGGHSAVVSVPQTAEGFILKVPRSQHQPLHLTAEQRQPVSADAHSHLHVRLQPRWGLLTHLHRLIRWNF